MILVGFDARSELCTKRRCGLIALVLIMLSWGSGRKQRKTILAKGKGRCRLKVTLFAGEKQAKFEFDKGVPLIWTRVKTSRSTAERWS